MSRRERSLLAIGCAAMVALFVLMGYLQLALPVAEEVYPSYEDAVGDGGIGLWMECVPRGAVELRVKANMSSGEHVASFGLSQRAFALFRSETVGLADDVIVSLPERPFGSWPLEREGPVSVADLRGSGVEIREYYRKEANSGREGRRYLAALVTGGSAACWNVSSPTRPQRVGKEGDAAE